MNPDIQASVAMAAAVAAFHSHPNRPRGRESPQWRGAVWSLREMDTRLRINAERERGKLIVTGRVFNPTNAAPPYLCAVRQWHSPRLLDHETWYRLDGARGPAGRTNTVVVTEPYLADAHVPAALSEWALALAKHSLTIRQLGRDLLLHAPVNPASQIFLIGPPALIG